MDKVNGYKQIVKKVLNEYVERDRKQPEPGVEYFLIADDANGHYLWQTLGWNGSENVNQTSIYLRLKNDKIYVEEDWTEEGIATDLLREGVPPEDIVLAFHAPELRQYTEFAAA